MEEQEKKASTGLVVVSFIVPIVGIVMWATKKNEMPTESKKYLYAAIAGIVVWSIVRVVGTVLSNS